MFDLSTYLNDRQRWIDAALDRHLPPGDMRPAALHEAMRYSIFSGGKRLRPVLCMAAAEVFGVPRETVLRPALALEAVHAYTLIHDDLPCMDNDDLRRGQSTTHTVFGEANALMAGSALLTLAFEWLACAVPPRPYPPGQYAVELAVAAGHEGVLAGQVEDLAAEGVDASADTLEFIHLHKTASLIRAAVRMGGLAGGAVSRDMDALTLFGCNLGLAFQITDDLLDETGTTQEIGKPIGSDRKNDKLTYVSVHGIEASREKARHLIEEALAALDPLSGPTDPLRSIATHVLNRKR